MGRKTVAISTAAPLPYLLITVKVITLEKVSFSDIQNPKTVFNTLTADDTYYLLDRENLREAIQMELSQKQKTFSEFFFCIFKTHIKF